MSATDPFHRVEFFSDVLWLSGRRIERADGSTISLSDEECVILGCLVLARGNWRSLKALRRVVGREGEALGSVVFNRTRDLIEKCASCTFDIVEDADNTKAKGLGWKVTGHIRVVT